MAATSLDRNYVKWHRSDKVQVWVNEFTGFDPEIQVFLSDFTVFTNTMLAALYTATTSK